MDIEKYKQAEKLFRKIHNLEVMSERIKNFLIDPSCDDIYSLSYDFKSDSELEILKIMNNICQYRITDEMTRIKEALEEL